MAQRERYFSKVAITCALFALLSVNGTALLCNPAAAKGKTAKESANSAAPNHPVPPGAERVDLVSDRPPVLRWPAKGTAKGAVLCLHELGMYSGVFADLGQRLSQEGYVVYAMDERGFGAWEKMTGPDARMNLDRILLDIKDSVTAMHEKESGLPIFLLGEAMGGALALKAAAQYPELIQGTISSAPGGDHFHSTHNYMTVCGKFFTGPNKRFAMGKELIASGTAREDVQNYMANEAQVRLNLTPKELMDCQFFMYKTKNFARQIKTVPVMIVQGQNDGETKPQSAKDVYDQLSTKDRKMLPVAAGDHYVYEDKHVDDNAMKETISWLDSHLNKPPEKPVAPPAGG